MILLCVIGTKGHMVRHHLCLSQATIGPPLALACSFPRGFVMCKAGSSVLPWKNNDIGPGTGMAAAPSGLIALPQVTTEPAG
jgi:hypothetical protein